MYAGIMLIWNVYHKVGLGRAEEIGNKQTVRVATQYAPALSERLYEALGRQRARRASPVGAPAPRAPPSRRNVAVVSHAQCVLTVTAAPASRVKAAISKAAW